MTQTITRHKRVATANTVISNILQQTTNIPKTQRPNARKKRNGLKKKAKQRAMIIRIMTMKMTTMMAMKLGKRIWKTSN